jgi:hypothetical protein
MGQARPTHRLVLVWISTTFSPEIPSMMASAPALSLVSPRRLRATWLMLEFLMAVGR